LLGRAKQGNRTALAEAKTLAEQAIAAATADGGAGNASFHDTLARIHLAAGDRESAVRSFEQSLAADERNLEAMIGLADVLARSDKLDEAKVLLVRINDTVRAAPPLSRALREQLETLRASITRPVESGRVE
jgi:predicted Zn-dependent protease